jgi:hypothetical protein
MFRQKITLQQAKEIALRSVPGQILHVDMDLEHGVLVYEIFILTAHHRIFEVEILAKTGKILKIEQEHDDDFDYHHYHHHNPYDNYNNHHNPYDNYNNHHNPYDNYNNHDNFNNFG